VYLCSAEDHLQACLKVEPILNEVAAAAAAADANVASRAKVLRSVFPFQIQFHKSWCTLQQMSAACVNQVYHLCRSQEVQDSEGPLAS
jgi:hypothetical protein